MIWRNKVPLTAVILNGIVAFILIYLAYLLLVRYFERKKKPALYLSLSFIFMSLAGILSFLGTLLAYTSSVSYLTFSWTDLGFISAFMAMAVANVFMVGFITVLYLDGASFYLNITGILNGITIGLLIYNFKPVFGTFNELANVTIYHAIITVIVFGLLTAKSLQESKKNSGLIKTGFKMIAYSGIAMLLVFPLFALDPMLSSILPNTYANGYTPFYYMGWIFVALFEIFGWLGYLMPNFFVQLIKAR